MSKGIYLPISIATVSYYILLNLPGGLIRLDLRAYVDAISLICTVSYCFVPLRKADCILFSRVMKVNLTFTSHFVGAAWFYQTITADECCH